MKYRNLLLISLLSTGVAVRAQSSFTVELVLNRTDAGGTMRVALCPSEESYSSQRGCVLKEVKATAGVVTVQFPNTPAGTYAVKVFHDEDDNGTLDTNWMGIPKEPYGFSNDAMGTFGPPSFQQASFKVGAGRTTIRIRMKG